MTVQLSDLELRILECISDGCHSKEIATIVRRSKPTVEGYVRLLYAKFNARSRAHLVLQAIRYGIIVARADADYMERGTP